MILSEYSGRKIRNRWLVAYTLVRNPSLIPTTANNLEAAAAIKKLYEVKTDVDSGEKDGLEESAKVDMSNVDVEKEDSSYWNESVNSIKTKIFIGCKVFLLDTTLIIVNIVRSRLAQI